MRSLLALCVAIGHMGLFPVFGPVGQTDAVLDLLARIWRTAVFAPAAVIAFFIISGFCIHYVFAQENASVPVGRFYARRYLRILVPVMCAVILMKILIPGVAILGSQSVLWHSVLWSLVCEEIYYGIYPLFNVLGRMISWGWLVTFSFAPALFVCWLFFPATDWQDIGVLPTAFTLLPVWLLGCYLAQHVAELRREFAAREIWLWRAGAFVTMWIALILHSHTSVHQTVSALGVGAVYYFWIRAEISYYKNREPWKVLVWAGGWSYSLYLTHVLAIALCLTYGRLSLTSQMDWILIFLFTLTFAYCFYLAVEKPSHRLARRIPLLNRAQPAPALVLPNA
jgi:peptidoglycan/LPS O-acetylase OafA/YrhL